MKTCRNILKFMETPLRYNGDTVVGPATNLHGSQCISRARSASKSHGYILLSTIYCLLFTLVLSGCGGGSDVDFARRVFTDLARGRYTARYQIDWPRLTALGKDIGAEYVSLANDDERQGYERAFIDGFKKGFREQRGTIRAFSHWRILTVTGDLKIVAADMQKSGMVLLVGVRRERGRRQVAELRMLKVLEPETFREFERGLPR